MVWGRPFLLGWIVHNVNSETQHHIFIIVIKLYCTKMLGQYLWEEQTGMRVATVGEMGGLEFGVNQPADSSAALDQPPRYNNHAVRICLTMDASQSCTKIRFTLLSLPEPQLELGLQPTGRPSRREEHK